MTTHFNEETDIILFPYSNVSDISALNRINSKVSMLAESRLGLDPPPPPPPHSLDNSQSIKSKGQCQVVEPILFIMLCSSPENLSENWIKKTV